MTNTMTNKEPPYIEQAFPGQYDHGRGQIESWVGMTLRDYFAAKAMQMKFGTEHSSISMPDMAVICYQMADAMLEARK